MNTKLKTYIALLMLMILASCKVTEKNTTPQAPLPMAYRNVANTDTANIADMQWKTFFTDAALQKLIDSAIANNYDMQAALKNIESAQLIVKQTKLGYLPDVKLQAAAS